MRCEIFSDFALRTLHLLRVRFFLFLRKIESMLSFFFEIKKPLCGGFLKVAERMGFEPMNRFWRLHTFQACALDQLGHLSGESNN
jgi:hypothetical protein